MKFLLRLIKLTLLAVLLAGLLTGVVGGAIFLLVLQGFAEELPVLDSAEYRPRRTTRIFDRNGGTLAELHAEVDRAEIVPITEIPVHTRRAFVSIEDDQFYEHYGVRPDALLRAVILNVIRGRKVQGGSTITMQLARNRFLHLRKTYTRKLKEMIMAFRLERHYTKDEILAQYLNEVFFGGKLHGIASAARYYFGKSVKDLGLAESTLLAGILPAPNRYSPLKNFKLAKRRQYMVLDKMWQLGYITNRQAKEAYSERLVFQGEETVETQAPYFVEHVRSWLVERLGAKAVYGGGLRVHTTLDPEMQAAAEDAFHAAKIFERYPLEEHPDLQGSFLVLDPMQGALRAMVGGRDFAVYKFNRAVQARRQTGSAFKPFVFAAAMQKGIQPNSIVNDEPVRYVFPDSQKVWEPQNSGGRFHGPVTLAQALEMSYNVVAVKLLERVGVEPVMTLAKHLGVRSPLEPGLTLALGTSEVTLVEMVSAYGAIANQGIHVAPHAVTRVEDDEGNVLYEGRIPEREVLDPRIAYQLTSLMRGVVERGTGTRARVPGYQIAGKTGTTQDKVDAWFIGFTPDLVVGTSISFDTRKTLGSRGDGGRTAAPIVGSFLKSYLTRFPAREFPRPAGVDEVEICKDSGFLPLQACKRKQTLVFLEGRGPGNYCHLHQAMEFRLQSKGRSPRRELAGTPSGGARAPAPSRPQPQAPSWAPGPSAAPRTPQRPAPARSTPAASGGGDFDLSF